jgi:uncharacterized membrane protein (UPF0182 family)
MLAAAFRYWLGRYALLYSRGDVTYGANYADVTVRLPWYGFLSILAGAIALLMLYQVYQFKIKNELIKKILLAWLTLTFVGGLLLPEIVQQLIVQPNELAREQPYIQRSIAFTKEAFDLNTIEIKTFDPAGKLTYADLEKNQLTISNIRCGTSDRCCKPPDSYSKSDPIIHFLMPISIATQSKMKKQKREIQKANKCFWQRGN